jgi:hypothetical protein
MSKLARFEEVRENALIGRDEGVAEEVAALREAPLDRRIDFLREVPTAKGAMVDDLLADLRALEEGKGFLASPMKTEPAPARSVRKGTLGGLIAGLLLGALMGAGGAWYAASEMTPAAIVPVVSEAPPLPPPPPSRWASPEEEDLYLRLSRSNGGMALAAHCRGEGKVEVEVADGRRNACLAWPPEE